MSEISISKKAMKYLQRVQPHIRYIFQAWVKIIEQKGIEKVQKMQRFKAHLLKGDRKGQRAIKLNKFIRVIYELEKRNNGQCIVKVKEIRGDHDYRKK